MTKIKGHGVAKTALVIAAAVAAMAATPAARADHRYGDWNDRRDGGGRYYDGRVSASDFGFNIDINLGSRERRREPVCEPPPPRVERVWVEPVYRTVCDRVWVAPQYRTVCDRVWHEQVVEDRCERVWIEPRYKTVKEVQIIGMSRYIVERKVLVCPGHFEDRHVQVVVRPGGWQNVERQELVCEGHWQNVERQELVCAGHWEDRAVSAPIAVRPRPWDSYDRGERYGG